MRQGLAATLAVLAAPGVLAACETTEIDIEKGEGFIRRVVTGQVGARVASVACPGEAEVTKGTRFSCEVTGTDGSKGRAFVIQRDNGGFRVVAPFLHVREAERVMARQIAREVHARVAVRCPEIIVVRTGRPFTCTRTVAGRARRFDVRLTDAAGHFRFRLS